MMKLGDYQFSRDTAAFHDYQRATKFLWVSHNVYGAGERLQFTGFGADTIKLAGVIYPHYRGGFGQVAAMRAEAGKGRPLPLIFIDTENAVTAFQGKWAILDVNEKKSVFETDGKARKIQFALTLKRYSHD